MRTSISTILLVLAFGLDLIKAELHQFLTCVNAVTFEGDQAIAGRPDANATRCACEYVKSNKQCSDCGYDGDNQDKPTCKSKWENLDGDQFQTACQLQCNADASLDMGKP